METLRIFKDSPIDRLIEKKATDFWRCWMGNNHKYPVWGYNSFDDFARHEIGISINSVYHSETYIDVNIHDPEKWLCFLLKL